MFDNIGGKIEGLAKVICWIGIIASVIGGIVMFVAAGEMRYGGGTYVALGFVVIIVGSLGSWIGSFFMYGFGELISDTSECRSYMYDIMRRLEKLPADTTASKNNSKEPVFSDELPRL